MDTEIRMWFIWFLLFGLTGLQMYVFFRHSSQALLIIFGFLHKVSFPNTLNGAFNALCSTLDYYRNCLKTENNYE